MNPAASTGPESLPEGEDVLNTLEYEVHAQHEEDNDEEATHCSSILPAKSAAHNGRKFCLSAWLFN